MGVSNENITTFSNDPKKGREVVDAYKGDKMSQFLAEEIEKVEPNLLTENFPDLKAEQINKVLNDPATKEYLSQSELSPQEMVSGAVKSLPGKVKLKDVVDNIPIPELFGLTATLRETLGSEKWGKVDADTLKNTHTKYKDYGENYGEEGNWEDIVSTIGLADTNDIETRYGKGTNVVVEAAYKSTVAENLISSGMVEEAITWIENDTLPEKLKGFIYRDMVNPTAESGHGDKVSDLISKAGSAWKPHHNEPTIRTILAGYRLGRGIPLNQYPEKAAELVDICDDIQPDWYLMEKDGKKVGSTKYLTRASLDAIEILFYDSRTRALSSTYKAFMPDSVSWKVLARRDFPYIVV